MNITRAAGMLYLVTFVTSIPTLALYAAVLGPDYVSSAGPDTLALVGAVLEIGLALACIGTAVLLYPLLKKHSEWMALGFVTARTLEAATIFAGVASVLAIVSLRQQGVGADGVVAAHALVGLHDALHLGQSLMPVVNAALLGTVLYRARLVPRILPAVGLIGAPLLLVTTLGALFGLWPAGGTVAGLGALPIALWEFSLGVWLLARGAKPREESRRPGAPAAV